jgi:hypothetical protein
MWVNRLKNIVFNNAQSLEMIIVAFLAGQIYESIDEDLSEQLHPFDR